MAAPARVELATVRLTAARSAIELWGNEWEVTGFPIRGRFANELPSRRLQRHVSTSFTNFPQAESRGIEPLAQGLPWFSRPVADRSAVPSMIGENGRS